MQVFGACSKALERLGIEHEIIDAVEIDKYAIESFNAIHNTNFDVQDITIWDKDIEVDLIMHGSPCQDFSVAGLNKGGDEGTGTRSSLMYETIRIVDKLKPKYVIWENVKNLLSQKHRHNFDRYLEEMEELGYSSYYQVLNSKDYGIPQNRERVFTISVRKDIDKRYTFPYKEELKLRLKDMLEENVNQKYYLSDKAIEGLKFQETLSHKPNYIEDKDVVNTIDTKVGDGTHFSPYIRVKNNTKQGYMKAEDGDSVNLSYQGSNTRRGRVGKEVSQTLQCNESMGVVTIGNYMPSNHDASRIVDNSGLAPTVKENHGTVTATNYGLRIRKLTPLECWRLQGFDDEDFYKAKERLNNTFYKGRDNSNSQLYKQAGNSITVNVLEKIFKNLFC